MTQQRFILALCSVLSTAMIEAEPVAVKPQEQLNQTSQEPVRGWHAKSRLQAPQWVGTWLVSRDGEARHVWSFGADGYGRSYAFVKNSGKTTFAYGYDIRWYFDPHTQMANIKTERRIICRAGKFYPYFITLKSYESDYLVKSKFSWLTTWTESTSGKNYLHKSLVLFIAPIMFWNNPKKGDPCPKFPSLKVEDDIDLLLDKWMAQQKYQSKLLKDKSSE